MIEYYTYADNPLVYRAFVQTAIDLNQDGHPLTTSEYRELAKHLSMIQGVSLGETMEENELVELLKEYVTEMRKTI